jgi:hypothetical protein
MACSCNTDNILLVGDPSFQQSPCKHEKKETEAVDTEKLLYASCFMH